MTTNENLLSSTNIRRLLRNGDIILAIAVIAIVGMMIIPLPPLMLDTLLALNIALAVTVILVALYIQKPLDFSVFPSLLLILTLFRLGLNISSTRLILLEAHAGKVIQAFGNFVVGGNYVVGIIVFLILMIIQFVVITNGSGRVAEVAARFTLDAMPGKQMSIDADLNAGLLTEEEARIQRKIIGQEADFYGAMDGSSKFVKGDAIAGIAIVFVNIIAGFAIGVLQLKMSLVEALQTYTLLTVGDGLVSQIPALLISTATGIIVTRTASDENMGNDVINQMIGNPRALMIVSVLLIGFAMIPGFPKLPFILMGGLTGGLSYFIRQERQPKDDIEHKLEEKTQATSPFAEIEAVTDLLQIDTLEVEIGYGLIPLVETNSGMSILNRITSIRRQIALELGFILPKVRIRDNLQLPPSNYAIKLRGEEIARGNLMVGHYLAIPSSLVKEELPGIPTTEPAFDLPALWIEGGYKERAEALGYTVVDAASVIGTHLTEVIRTYAPEILTRQDTRELLDNLKKDYPTLVDDLIPQVLSLGEIHEILKNLLHERVSIRDLVTILEAVSSVATGIKDVDLISEAVRQRLARMISNQHRAADGVLYVMTLSPRIEKLLSDSIEYQNHDLKLSLEPRLAQKLMEVTAKNMENMAAQGYLPVILCSATIRLVFKRLVERALPSLSVLSYSEIASGIDVHAQGMIDFDLRTEIKTAGEPHSPKTEVIAT